MKILILGIAITGALCLTTAIAGEPATPTAEPSPVQKVDAAKPAADDKVCTMEKSLGSNMKQRVCRTRVQYEAEREGAREALERSQQGGRSR